MQLAGINFLEPSKMSNFQPALMLPPLTTLEWLQGSPEEFTHDIQLMLLIQPNCPGCHTEALPLANKLTETKQAFDLYCISTAFEEFEYNTKASAQSLLDGKHVGIPKQRLGETVEHIPKMPLAYDNVIAKTEAKSEYIAMALEATKYITYEQAQELNPSITIGMIERQIEKMGTDLLPEYIAETFYKVRAKGTPTWVVHKSNGEVLDVKFGHLSEKAILDWIEQYV